jgi:hypothetical protein
MKTGGCIIVLFRFICRLKGGRESLQPLLGKSGWGRHNLAYIGSCSGEGTPFPSVAGPKQEGKPAYGLLGIRNTTDIGHPLTQRYSVGPAPVLIVVAA